MISFFGLIIRKTFVYTLKLIRSLCARECECVCILTATQRVSVIDNFLEEVPPLSCEISIAWIQIALVVSPMMSTLSTSHNGLNLEL